jgi:hypothetical protein
VRLAAVVYEDVDYRGEDKIINGAHPCTATTSDREYWWNP